MICLKKPKIVSRYHSILNVNILNEKILPKTLTRLSSHLGILYVNVSQLNRVQTTHY